ncbi:MAG: signal peptidase II [Clostridiales bacterium]|nr:signal peptidase II [Clostridiales bacterium]
MAKRKNIIGLVWQILLALVIVLIDRVTKMYVIGNCALGERFGELPFVADFVYVQNTGAAFSMLENNTILLSVISVAFIIAIIIYKIIRKPEHFMENLAVTLFFAGGLGNAIDRIQYKFVVDFIDIKWFNFPVFNIADMAVVLGAVAAIVYVIFFDKGAENGNS